MLRKLLKFDPANELVIHVAMDNTLILSEVKAACLQPKSGRHIFSLCALAVFGIRDPVPF